MKKISAGHRFAAALALYLLWVVALTALAFTSASRPANRMILPGAATAPIEDSPPR